jgi:hypothetical protein
VRLLDLSKEQLVNLIEKLYQNLIKEPKYNIYSKAFFIEYLKQTLEIYKRYKNMKITLLLFPFDETKIKEVKSHLRKSDLLAKYDGAFAVLLFETGEIGTLKVKNKIEKLLNKKGIMVNITIDRSVEDIIKEIENKVKIFY